LENARADGDEERVAELEMEETAAQEQLDALTMEWELL
jgi:hypothetical protein